MASTEDLLNVLLRHLEDEEGDAPVAAVPKKKAPAKSKTSFARPVVPTEPEHVFEERPRPARAKKSTTPAAAPTPAAKPRKSKVVEEEAVDPRLPVRAGVHRCNCSHCPLK